MTDFTVYTETNAPEASRPTLNTAKTAFGFVPNLLGMLAESPAAVETYLTLAGLMDKTSLTPVERQVVLLTASFENTCTYCMAAHSTVAKGAGMTDDTLVGLRAGRALADAKLNALADFTRQVVRERGFVSETDVTTFLAAGFTKANVFDVIVGVSLKTLSNYTNHIAETPVDAAFQPQAWTKPTQS